MCVCLFCFSRSMGLRCALHQEPCTAGPTAVWLGFIESKGSGVFKGRGAARTWSFNPHLLSIAWRVTYVSTLGIPAWLCTTWTMSGKPRLARSNASKLIIPFPVSLQRRPTRNWPPRPWRSWIGAWTSWRPCRPDTPSVRWPPTRWVTIQLPT